MVKTYPSSSLLPRPLPTCFLPNSGDQIPQDLGHPSPHAHPSLPSLTLSFPNPQSTSAALTAPHRAPTRQRPSFAPLPHSQPSLSHHPGHPTCRGCQRARQFPRPRHRVLSAPLSPLDNALSETIHSPTKSRSPNRCPPLQWTPLRSRPTPIP